MFCSNCGNQLPDNANFCSACGAQINNVQNHEIMSKQSSLLPKIVKRFEIGYNSSAVEITEDIDIHNSVRSLLENRENIDEEAAREILTKIMEQDDVDKVFASLTYTGLEALTGRYIETFQFAVNILQNFDVYHIDINNFGKMIMADERFLSAMLPMKESIEIIVEYKKALDNNDSSFRFQGGGFGITGAVMGAAKAEALNLGIDAVSGLAKMITGNTDSDKLRKAKATLIKEKKLASSFLSLAHMFSELIIEYTINILNNETGFPLCEYDKERFEGTYRNIVRAYLDNRLSPQDTIDKLCSMIEHYPYHLYPYRYMYHIAPKTKAKLMQLAEYFGMEVMSVFEYDDNNPDKIPGLS